MCRSLNTKPAPGLDSPWRSRTNAASVLTRQPEFYWYWKQHMHHDSRTLLLSFSAIWYVHFRHCKIKFFLHWRNERLKWHLQRQQRELSISFAKCRKSSKCPESSNSWNNFWYQKCKFLRIILALESYLRMQPDGISTFQIIVPSSPALSMAICQKGSIIYVFDSHHHSKSGAKIVFCKSHLLIDFAYFTEVVMSILGKQGDNRSNNYLYQSQKKRRLV